MKLPLLYVLTFAIAPSSEAKVDSLLKESTKSFSSHQRIQNKEAIDLDCTDEKSSPYFDKEAFSELVSLAENARNREKQEAAIDLLGKIGCRLAVPTLIKIIESEDYSNHIRFNAYSALARIKSDESFAYVASKVDQPFSKEVEDFNDFTQYFISKTATPNSFDRLIAIATTTKDHRFKSGALLGMGLVSEAVDASKAKQLLPLLNNPESIVRFRALESIQAMSRKPKVDSALAGELLSAVEKASETEKNRQVSGLMMDLKVELKAQVSGEKVTISLSSLYSMLEQVSRLAKDTNNYRTYVDARYSASTLEDMKAVENFHRANSTKAMLLSLDGGSGLQAGFQNLILHSLYK